jgi:hypothetical protein
MKKVFITLFLFFAYFPGHSQGLQSWIDSQKYLVYEKVYLHVDREFYAPGDIIWFKTYLVSGLTHQLLPGYKNIFVQLVSEGGTVISDRIILSIGGVAQGDLQISDSIPNGHYFIRAYTRYLENFSEKSCFHQKILISRDYNPPETGTLADTGGKIDIAFLPESGTLVLNALNYIAFKAIDETGRGINISGKIVDENDTLVTTFRTDFQGMGRVIMMPQEKKSYFAKIDHHPEIFYRFGDGQENGYALHYKEDGENLLFTVSRNFNKSEKSKIYLAASHKGVVLFYREIEISGFNEVLKIRKNILPSGISKITLLDADLEVQAERLVFIGDKPGLFKLELSGKEFTTRSKVEGNLDFHSDDGDTIQSTLSVAVVSKDYVSIGGNTLNMRSYLLLDSELKGIIENPSSYFIDEEKISSSAKLDLLMMVQGWRSYYWNELNNYHFAKLKGWDDAGLTVQGYVKALFKNRPIIGGEVVLGPFSKTFLFEETRTDSLGRFKFDRLYLKDSALVILNAKNEKDRANTEIIPDPVFPFRTSIPAWPLRNLYPWPTVPMMYHRDEYYRQLKNEEYIPGKGNILLGEVVVIGSRKEKEDGHFRLYGEPDETLKIKEEDYTYQNILDYLDGKVAGLIVSGDQISMRGGGMPLFLLDGMVVLDEMVNDLILHTHISDIDKIEVLKSGGTMAFLGSKGADGVIAIYTKKGDVSAEIKRYVKGRIILRVRGFRKPAQFYSPMYTLENIDNPKADYRPTIFWEPALQMAGDKATFSFYTSDEQTEYSVVVEGISKKGKICSIRSDFSVTGKNTR